MCVAIMLGPWMTHSFLLANTRTYVRSYVVTIVVMLVGIVLAIEQLFGAWLIYCSFGLLLAFIQFIRERRSLREIGILIPLVFSVISALWFIAATNDLRMLGYSEAWSLYAAIHGAFLGWIFNGTLIRLCDSLHDPRYLMLVYFNLALFLCVAFGIDGTPWLKKVGVLGLTITVPSAITLFAFTSKGSGLSRVLSCLSLVAILISMSLAVMNEFLPEFPRYTLGLPTMVWSHGMLNALVTIPCFYFAVLLGAKQKDQRM
jgi:hypothetical protein